MIYVKAHSTQLPHTHHDTRGMTRATQVCMHSEGECNLLGARPRAPSEGGGSDSGCEEHDRGSTYELQRVTQRDLDHSTSRTYL